MLFGGVGVHWKGREGRKEVGWRKRRKEGGGGGNTCMYTLLYSTGIDYLSVRVLDFELWQSDDHPSTASFIDIDPL